MNFEEFLFKLRKSKTDVSLDLLTQRLLDRYENDALACLNIRSASSQRCLEIQEISSPEKTSLATFSETIRQAEAKTNQRIPEHLAEQLDSIFAEYGGSPS